MAELLVLNTSYPAHSLDRLWYLHSWNEAALTLFEIDEETARSKRTHLLEQVFGVQRRQHFHGWENLARRLVSDFQYNTRTLTHLPEYKELLKHLRELPEFRRIAAATYPEGKPTPSFVFSSPTHSTRAHGPAYRHHRLHRYQQLFYGQLRAWRSAHPGSVSPISLATE